MTTLLMPKATAVWLVENSTLTFLQIGDLCRLHELEVQAIADGEVAIGIVGLDPIVNGQLTRAELQRCEADPVARLKVAESDIPQPVVRQKGSRYTPVSKRADKPDAIAWMVRNQPDLTDAQISRLIGITKPTITAVRNKTHWNSSNLRPRSPVEVGLCTHLELRDAVIKAAKRVEKRDGKKAVESTPEPLPVAVPVAVPVPSRESAMAAALAADAAAPKPPAPRQPTVEDLWPTADKPGSSKTPA
jgi:hypothetical protein